MCVGGQGRDLVTILQEGGWAPVPIWTSIGNLPHTENRSPDRPIADYGIPAHECLQCSNNSWQKYSL